MFPAGAGMNRTGLWLKNLPAHVPRRSGDEPGGGGEYPMFPVEAEMNCGVVLRGYLAGSQRSF